VQNKAQNLGCQALRHLTWEAGLHPGRGVLTRHGQAHPTRRRNARTFKDHTLASALPNSMKAMPLSSPESRSMGSLTCRVMDKGVSGRK